KRCSAAPARRRCGVRKRVWLVALAALAACNPDDVVHRVGWFATMRHQRSIKPYARPIPPVAGTVPITGVEPAADLTTADRLANPRTRTSESINRARCGATTAGTSSTTSARSKRKRGAGAERSDERSHRWFPRAAGREGTTVPGRGVHRLRGRGVRRRRGGVPVGAHDRPGRPSVAGLPRELHVLDRAGAGPGRVRGYAEAREGALVGPPDPIRRVRRRVSGDRPGAVPGPRARAGLH